MNTCARPEGVSTALTVIYETTGEQVDTKGKFLDYFELASADVTLVDPEDATNDLNGAIVIITITDDDDDTELLACAEIVREKSEQRGRRYHETRFERAGAPALQPDQAFSDN